MRELHIYIFAMHANRTEKLLYAGITDIIWHVLHVMYIHCNRLFKRHLMLSVLHVKPLDANYINNDPNKVKVHMFPGAKSYFIGAIAL